MWASPENYRCLFNEMFLFFISHSTISMVLDWQVSFFSLKIAKLGGNSTWYTIWSWAFVWNTEGNKHNLPGKQLIDTSLLWLHSYPVYMVSHSSMLSSDPSHLTPLFSMEPDPCPKTAPPYACEVFLKEGLLNVYIRLHM